MNEIRLFIAAIAFITGLYLSYDLLTNDFNLYVLSAAIVSFITAHILLPGKRKQTGNNSMNAFDLLEIIIDFPYQTVALFLRAIGRIFGGKDGGIDIDF